MKILHIGDIGNDPLNGICVVVPQHVRHQSEYAQVYYLNVHGEKIEGLKNQVDFVAPFDIKTLALPFGIPDLVIFHGVYIPDFLKISKNLKKNNVPYIIVPHGSLVKAAQKKKWLKKFVANILLFNSFINGALAIQCLSQQEMECTRFGKKKFVSTNGMDLPIRYKDSFHKERIDFVYVGRLDSYHKGLDLMIKAVAAERQLFIENNCHLAIYGPDHVGRYAQVEKLIRDNNVESLVSLSHEVIGEEKERILLGGDVFIQTSRLEGMPMGILEAMSYGLPVLVTEGTTLGDIVREYDCGWVAKTDEGSIAEQLRKCVASVSEYEKKSQNAVRAIAERFSWETVARNAVSEYEARLREGE